MKKYLIILFLFLFGCVEEQPDIFVTKHNLSSSVTFDFSKSYSVELGTVTFLNKENKEKKWRFIYHAPVACLYNRKTKKCNAKEGMPLVSNNTDPETADSVVMALLDSATTYTPVKAHGSTKVTVYLNLNFYPQPRQMIQHIRKNHKDLEYRIFIRTGEVVSPDMSGTPDFVINSIQVIQ